MSSSYHAERGQSTCRETLSLHFFSSYLNLTTLPTPTKCSKLRLHLSSTFFSSLLYIATCSQHFPLIWWSFLLSCIYKSLKTCYPLSCGWTSQKTSHFSAEVLILTYPRRMASSAKRHPSEHCHWIGQQVQEYQKPNYQPNDSLQ